MVASMDHVGIVVHNIDGALPYFLERLGLRLVHREELPATGVRLAYLASATTTLQLVEPTGPGPLRDDLETLGEGLHHLCFAVPDIPAALPILAPGAEIRISLGGRGRRTCFLPERPTGLRIELTETKPAAAG